MYRIKKVIVINKPLIMLAFFIQNYRCDLVFDKYNFSFWETQMFVISVPFTVHHFL